ncbi:ribonuclease H-like domain-containing protein [Tanacetum coccineum]
MDGKGERERRRKEAEMLLGGVREASGVRFQLKPKLTLWSLKIKMAYDAIFDEYNSLIKNDTWVLIPRPFVSNIVRSLWLFWHKFHADGSLVCIKPDGIDCDETFISIVKATTIRTVLSLALTTCTSTRQAEYRGIANVVAETAWLNNLLRELYIQLLTATLVYCDNVSVVYLLTNLVQHQRTKHIKIDIHFVRDMVAIGHVRVLNVSSRYQYADIFTKGLPSELFEEFCTSLSV